MASRITAPGAGEYVPPTADLGTLAAAAQSCRGCGLYRDATQAVFGQGPPAAHVLMVGEQPGEAVMGPTFRLTEQRGKLINDVPGPFSEAAVMCTIHPSAVLRAQDRNDMYAGFVADLQIISARAP